MIYDSIHLKILLPFQVFLEKDDVKKITVETRSGSYGFLPNRLDCTAALVPGIVTFESDQEGLVYLAVDDGIFVKEGRNVFMSVRNAVGNTGLGKLHEAIQQEFLNLDKNEREARLMLGKLESIFLKRFHKLGQ
jgi:F-type H+-transporting ATPase subunit epsilon